MAYRSLERPYTRYSKFKNKSFVRARPTNRVVRYDMGDEKKNYSHRLRLTSKTALQIRDVSIEAARQTTNRHLEKHLGKGNYKLKIMIYPHHVLRENPLAAGAGADRMSTGMKMSFGKAIGVAAQVPKGKILMMLDVFEVNIEQAKVALKKAQYKFPCSCLLTVEKIERKKVAPKKIETKA